MVRRIWRRLCEPAFDRTHFFSRWKRSGLAGTRLVRAGLECLALTLVAAVCAGAQSAAAEDVWTAPYPGVSHLHRFEDRIDLHVLLIDLKYADVSVVATRPDDRRRTVRNFARNYAADIAFNANYYHVDSRACGLAAGDGRVWRDSYRSGCVMSFGFGADNEAVAFNSSDWFRGPLPRAWMRHVVSGKPWLVRHGLGRYQHRWPRFLRYRHPRTALGLTQDRGTLIVLVADGRRADAAGLNGVELTNLMLEFGAHDAVNLDGGGSSELFVRSEGGVQNKPSDGRARRVSNHLGIRFGQGLRGWIEN